STRGVIPTSRSLDEVGPICRSVRDCALLFDVIAGRPQFRLNPTKLTRIGIPRPFHDALHPEIKRAVDYALDALSRLGLKLHDVDLPGLNMATDEGLPGIPLSGVWSAIVGFEAMSFHQSLLEKTPQLYGQEVYKRIAGGPKITREVYE